MKDIKAEILKHNTKTISTAAKVSCSDRHAAFLVTFHNPQDSYDCVRPPCTGEVVDEYYEFFNDKEVADSREVTFQLKVSGIPEAAYTYVGWTGDDVHIIYCLPGSSP
jgi:hypothetical protein